MQSNKPIPDSVTRLLHNVRRHGLTRTLLANEKILEYVKSYCLMLIEQKHEIQINDGRV